MAAAPRDEVRQSALFGVSSAANQVLSEYVGHERSRGGLIRSRTFSALMGVSGRRYLFTGRNTVLTCLRAPLD